MKKAIVALGGNALIKTNQSGNIHEQFANTREISSSIVKMIQQDWKVVITHGNGPQVGSILLQNEATRDVLPPMPLGVCVAESQGLIGYMIQQCLGNALKKENVDKPVATVITQVLVDQDDPSFTNPTKPIGPTYQKKEIEKIKQEGHSVKKTTDGWRIVVPSPDPISVIERDVIKTMLDDDIIVIAAGGGGMPVVEKPGWGIDGVEAVVDKDLASEILAEEINADLLFILTNVEKVYINYKKSDQKSLDKVNLKQIKEYYDQGQFPSGTMGPKILAAVRFLEQGGNKVIISHVEKAWEALNGETGTHITK